jgi:ATP-dependent DNA helicase PIF1
LTGPGGTGKSYLIHYIRDNCEDVAVTALTGCAALLLGQGAKTIYSWAGIGLGKETVDELVTKIRRNGRTKKNWRSTQTLVIDEISMMPADLFEKLDAIGRKVRGVQRPFGGIQLVLSGDFFQLPPIAAAGQTRFVFESPVWAEAVQESIVLTEIKRQSDPMFQDILNAARQGRLTEEHLDILRARKGLPWQSEAIRPTLLFSRRTEVDAINDANLKALTGPRMTYTVETVDIPTGSPAKKQAQLPFALNAPGKMTTAYSKATEEAAALVDKNAPYQAELVLAPGAQVMLLYNMDITAGLVNGSRGVVTGFSQEAGKYPIVQFKHCTRMIAPHTWPLGDGFPGLARQQVPLTLAYAQTIHKCQGSTLDSALIDIGSRTFEYGQAYVALSRVKSLDSLYIWDIDPAALMVHPRVTAFYQSIAV